MLTNPSIAFSRLGAGLATEFGTLTPPGSKVAAYVCSDTSVDMSGVPGWTPSTTIYTTLNKGLAQCRAGQNDIVFVLPGHAENISSADYMSSLVAGTRIIGLGVGTNRPTFTWTATGATFLFDVANTVLSNCILNLAGSRSSTTALTVTAPITISAAGCAILGCQINFAVDADQLSTIGITTTAAADDLVIAGCDMDAGTSDGTGVTTHIQFVGADRLRMWDCTINGATSAVGVGVVRFLTTASLNVDIRRCWFRNNKAASTTAFTGMAGLTGVAMDCGVGILDNLTTTFGATLGSLQTIRCYTANELAENGLLSTPVSA